MTKSSFEIFSKWQPSDKEYELLNQLALDDMPNDELKALLAQGENLINKINSIEFCQANKNLL